MAAPGQFQYNLNGEGVYFINSDDNKIRITGYAPTVDIESSGFVYPTTASLTLGEQTPTTTGQVYPSVGSLALTGNQPSILGEDQPVDPAKVGVAITGYAPSLNRAAIPSLASIALSGLTPARWTGIKFESDPVTLQFGVVSPPSVGGLAFASVQPDVELVTAGSSTRTPVLGSMALSGLAPVAAINNVTLPTVVAVTVQGRLTNVDEVVYPSATSLTVTGYQPVPESPEGIPSVVIAGPFNYGTFIVNTNAITDAPSNYLIDDRTGFRQKVKKGLTEEWTGHWVRPDSHDKRNLQQRVRSKAERHTGAERPDDTGRERFIDDLYPDGVDADDL